MIGRPMVAAALAAVVAVHPPLEGPVVAFVEVCGVLCTARVHCCVQGCFVCVWCLRACLVGGGSGGASSPLSLCLTAGTLCAKKKHSPFALSQKKKQGVGERARAGRVGDEAVLAAQRSRRQARRICQVLWCLEGERAV